ncbi:MAG: hypothetical protein ACI81I_000309, partial [Arcobacteraceae bacterium]
TPNLSIVSATPPVNPKVDTRNPDLPLLFKVKYLQKYMLSLVMYKLLYAKINKKDKSMQKLIIVFLTSALILSITLHAVCTADVDMGGQQILNLKEQKMGDDLADTTAMTIGYPKTRIYASGDLIGATGTNFLNMKYATIINGAVPLNEQGIQPTVDGLFLVSLSFQIRNNYGLGSGASCIAYLSYAPNLTQARFRNAVLWGGTNSEDLTCAITLVVDYKASDNAAIRLYAQSEGTQSGTIDENQQVVQKFATVSNWASWSIVQLH